MADKDLDYHIDEDLEQLFHSDLQNLELGHEETNQDDVIGDHLPEWLVGVIVVIIMLIVAFFVMIITSLIKNRQKNRSSTYTGAPSSTACDDLESGKIGSAEDPGMKMTSFTAVPEALNESALISHTDQGLCDQEHLTSSQVGADGVHGIQGCRNPLFVDDDPDSEDNPKQVNDAGEEILDNKEVVKEDPSDLYTPSTSNGQRGSDILDHGTSKGMPHKYKHSSNSKKSAHPSKSPDIREEQLSETEGETRKRMFASKSKASGHAGSKRERNKGMTVSDIISRDTDGHRRDRAGETSKRVDQVKSGGSSRKSSKEKDENGNGCCEDSGVELGSAESPTKEEGSGCSEADDVIPAPTRQTIEETDVEFSIASHKDEVRISVTTSNVNVHNSPTPYKSTVNLSPNVCDKEIEIHKEQLTTSDDEPTTALSPHSPKLSNEDGVGLIKDHDSNRSQMNLDLDQENSKPACPGSAQLHRQGDDSMIQEIHKNDNVMNEENGTKDVDEDHVAEMLLEELNSLSVQSVKQLNVEPSKTADTDEVPSTDPCNADTPKYEASAPQDSQEAAETTIAVEKVYSTNL